MKPDVAYSTYGLKTTYVHPTLGHLIVRSTGFDVPQIELGDVSDPIAAPGVRDSIALVAKKVYDAVLDVCADTHRASIEAVRCTVDFVSGLGYTGVDMEVLS